MSSTDATKLSRRIAAGTAVAWVVGVLLLATLCIVVAHQGRDKAVDSKLIAHALAAYGLGWWDAQGEFHDEILLLEDELFEGEVEVSIATPEGTVFGPEKRRHQTEGLDLLLKPVALRCGEPFGSRRHHDIGSHVPAAPLAKTTGRQGPARSKGPTRVKQVDI